MKCAFFCGADLPTDANDRTVDVNLPGNVHWHFTWTYTLTPTGPIDPQTCWECTQSGGGSVDVQFCGFVAGESFVLKQGGNSPWTKKYSFTLTDPDPITGLPVSRVTNVMATLQLSTDGGTTWNDVQGPFALDTSTIVSCGRPTDSVGGTFCDGLGPVMDYIYDANAGAGGTSTIWNYLHSSGTGIPAATYLAPDYTDNIMSGIPPSQDNFAGNNHDLCDYSQTAPFFVDFPVIIQAGDYRIHLTGTVKGNSAVADQQFDVTGGGTVTVNGCDPECEIPNQCPE